MKKVIRIIALWDLCLTLPFAIPGFVIFSIQALEWLDRVIGSGLSFPRFDSLHLLFVNLFGILAVLWAVVRLYKPETYLAVFDTCGRLVVGSVLVGYWLWGGTPVSAVFSISEWLGAGLAGYFLLKKTST